MLFSGNEDPRRIAYWASVTGITLIIAGNGVLSRMSEEKDVRLAKEANAVEWQRGVALREIQGGPLEKVTYAFPGTIGTLSGKDGARVHESLGEEPTRVRADGTVQGNGALSLSASGSENGIARYIVKEGDTLSKIAANFSISIETIRWANKELAKNNSVLRAGQEMIILPVSGVLHSVQEEDSLESIASRYQANQEVIKRYNPEFQKILGGEGGKLIIPSARPTGAGDQGKAARAADARGYLMLPARGRNWGELHYENAVDIADKCGAPVFASAEGLVTEESGERYWNQGYGNYITIEHPNGISTKYAHTEKNLVKMGDYVSQGTKIALVGNTGKITGKNGCHVHFEVRGAPNPFASQ